MAGAEPAGRRVGITVREALALPALASGRLVAGERGLDRRITSVNMMEVPDIGGYVRPGELLVTTAYPLRGDARALDELVRMLAARQLAGLAIKPRRYIDEMPGAMVAVADRLGFPVIELPDGASFNDILADVLGSILNRHALQLERSRVIHDRLTTVALAGGSLHDLLEALTSLVGHGSAVFDPHGELIASAGAQSPGVAAARTSRPVQAGAQRHGEMVLWAGEAEIGPDGVVALEHAATIAALEIAQARILLAREQRHRVLLLQELVSGALRDPEEIAERVAAYGWNFTVPRAAVVAVVQDESGGPPEVGGRPLEEQLVGVARQVLGRNAIAWALRSGIAILVDASEAPALAAARRFASAVGRELPSLHLAVGVGRTCSGVDDLHASYREATEAAGLGRELRGSDFVIGYEELGIYRLLQSMVAGGALRRFCDETLGPLLDYDRRHRGSLVRTLDTYLRLDRNMAAAARELFVHYNTLRYRVQQISTLTGGLDRHPTSRLALEVAVHGLKVLR
jgi:PucR family transcriptional regulator, purine catabolism regulatory protein